MIAVTRQQIALSGIGGQGVLFITKLLAETALQQGWSVLISETHGMAQRGGNVISHLKVWNPRANDSGAGSSHPFAFSSPLIRAGCADLLLALHPEAAQAHGFYLKAGAAAIVNSPSTDRPGTLDADAVAAEIGRPIAANLVLLGFAAGRRVLFCSAEALRATLETLGGPRREINLEAFQAGLTQAGH